MLLDMLRIDQCDDAVKTIKGHDFLQLGLGLVVRVRVRVRVSG